MDVALKHIQRAQTRPTMLKKQPLAFAVNWSFSRTYSFSNHYFSSSARPNSGDKTMKTVLFLIFSCKGPVILPNIIDVWKRSLANALRESFDVSKSLLQIFNASNWLRSKLLSVSHNGWIFKLNAIFKTWEFIWLNNACFYYFLSQQKPCGDFIIWSPWSSPRFLLSPLTLSQSAVKVFLQICVASTSSFRTPTSVQTRSNGGISTSDGEMTSRNLSTMPGSPM